MRYCYYYLRSVLIIIHLSICMPLNCFTSIKNDRREYLPKRGHLVKQSAAPDRREARD
jgi:hypothetical protein